MPISPEEILGAIPEKTVERLYDDALSNPAREVGKLGTDALKALRLLLAPVQLLAAMQDRFGAMAERIAKRVPEERRVEAPAEIVGPALERMRYLHSHSDLWNMYEEVLTKAVDCDAATSIHPAFVNIVSQLSRDEAWIIYRLRDRSFEVVDTMDLIDDRWENRIVEKSELPLTELCVPKLIDLYYSHLESLSLVVWPVWKQEPIYKAGRQTGIRRHSRMQLTDFGRLFAAACIPPEGFAPTTGVGQ